MTKHAHDIESAYQEALVFTKSHYENFPVISLFLSKKVRKHVAVVYQFARQADDIADEGNLTTDERLRQLNDYQNFLNQSLDGNPPSIYWEALIKTITEKNLSTDNFHKLLDAFKQDIVKNRYDTFAEIENYCSRSANPVGRIILELHGIYDEEANQFSDSICTALQLTNFYQDVSIDIQKDRIYIPIEELKMYDITEEMFQKKNFNSNFKKLMQHQVERAGKLYDIGGNLLPKLPWNLKRQIAWTIGGGKAILKKIEENSFDVLNSRPTLSKQDFLKILLGMN
ncbi:MAG: squalene synthase HpnC [Bacteroidota bacterium]